MNGLHSLQQCYVITQRFYQWGEMGPFIILIQSEILELYKSNIIFIKQQKEKLKQRRKITRTES